jgi:hypothetical protein
MSLGRVKFEARFYSKIRSTENGCWEWQGAKAHHGYGKCKYFGQQLAHRVSYILHHRVDLTPDVCVCHTCLFLGDKDTNNKDRHAKGRTVIHNKGKTHCKRGHEFNKENTKLRPNGARKCRICVNMKSLELHHRKKGNK